LRRAAPGPGRPLAARSRTGCPVGVSSPGCLRRVGGKEGRVTSMAEPLPRQRAKGFSGSDWARLAMAVWLMLVLGSALYAHWHPNTPSVYDIYSSAARRWT